MKIWLVEDDFLQAETIEKALSEHYSEVVIITSESEFCRRVEEIVKGQPCALVLDVMLRWADPGPETPVPPPIVKDKGPYLAGFRCLEKLAEAGGQALPVVLFTVLDRSDVEAPLGAAMQHFSRLEFQQKAGQENRLAECLARLLRG